jgi:pimeloyl-ACP methyl ester carboxylesterase
MKTIYKSVEGRRKIIDLYDKQLSRLSMHFADVWVDTAYGKTHLIETGNLNGIPLLVFHGGNATTASCLCACDFLMKDCHIFAVDTIGHPGKSAETCLSAANYDYGKWASQIIDKLGFKSISLFGGSFGAGIAAKTLCVSPEKINRAVLYVPAGIKNAPAINSLNMMFPMIMYRITHKDKWFRKCLLPMAVTGDNISRDIFETAKLSIDYSKVKISMPSNIHEHLIAKCKAPVLVLAAEKDCLFPGFGVIRRAERIIKNCTTYLLKDRGHMNALSADEKQMIVDFLNTL